MKPVRSTNSHGSAGPDDPLGEYRAHFLQVLESQHYHRATIAQYGHRLDALARQMQASKVALEDLDEARAIELMGESALPSFRGRPATYSIRKFIKFLSDSGVTKPNTVSPLGDERDPLKREFETHLRVQRGLSERTIFHSWRFAHRFLEFRFSGGAADLSQITAHDIARFLQHLASRGKPYRDKTPPTHLRSFFRFLFRTARTATDLAPSIPRVAQRYGARLPRFLTPDQVEQLLAAVRADTPLGRRNYAMVLLSARLGLRAPEVIAIRIDDIDWRKGEILVRGKGQRHDRLPLPPDVGEALAEYVRRDRVTASRLLFVTDRAPRRPFPDGQILNLILRHAFAKAGLTPRTPYVGSHILRHSLATSLIRQGATLAEIGDLLRHRSHQSTMIYAKLDVEGLRSIASSWPATGGAQ